MKRNILGLTLIVMAAVVWFGYPTYRSHKEKKFTARATEALAKKDYRQALLSAQQVLSVNTNSLAACLVMAELADLSRSPHAMVWRQRVAEIEPTVSNRVVFAACALRYEQPPFPLTAQALTALTPVAQSNTAFHITVAQFALKQGRNAEGEKHLEEAIRLEPGNPQHRINLAVVRLESRDPAVSAVARAELEKLQSPAALRALVVHHAGRQQFADAERFSTVLLRTPEATFADKLEHLVVLRGAGSATFDGFLKTLEGEAGTNVYAAAELVSALVQMNLSDPAITWAKTLPARMQNEAPLPMTVASAYFALNRWRDLETALNGQKWEEREFARKALLAYAQRKQNANDAANAHWKDALQLAAARPELLGALAQMTGAWNWTNETETVLWRAAKDFPKERWPIDSLQAGYTRMKNTAKLYDLNVFALEHQPTNAYAQNNWAALALLLQTNTAKAHELAKKVYERDAKNAGFASTYAFSLFVQGKAAEAAKVMDALQPAALEDPGLACYYGIVLAGAGQAEKARTYLDKAVPAALLPEELKLVADARKKL